MKLKNSIGKFVVLSGLLALPAVADTFTYHIGQVEIHCSNLEGWESAKVSDGDFFVEVGAESSCPSVTDHQVDFAQLAYGWEVESGDFQGMFHPDIAELWGFISVTGGTLAIPQSGGEVSSRVAWSTIGGGQSGVQPDVGFSFSGEGSGVANFSFYESHGEIKLGTVDYLLDSKVISATGDVVSGSIVPNPEPGGLILLGSALLALAIAWIGVKRG